MTVDDTIHDSMLKKEQLILINSEEGKNPVYRALVQTPGELPYAEYGIDVNYKEEGFKEAMKTLIGHHVSEEPDGHERKLGITPPPFGIVTKADYCPDYGGWADIEIYNDNYKPVFANMYDRLKDGLPVKKKFSTDATPIDMIPKGNNKFDLNKWNYDTLKMTTHPRDPKTGLCDVLVNSEDFKEDETVTDEIKLTQEQYDELLQAKADKEDLETKYQKGKELYDNLKPEDFKEFNEAQTEIKDLKQQLIPIWNQVEADKVALVNSLVDSLPEDKKEGAKKRYDKMELEDLKLIKLTNSVGEPAPGFTGRGVGSVNKPEDNDKEVINKLKDLGYFD